MRYTVHVINVRTRAIRSAHSSPDAICAAPHRPRGQTALARRLASSLSPISHHTMAPAVAANQARVVGCGHDVRAAHRHLKACERRETCTRPSGEVEGFGLRAGCALAHRMCRVWAPAPLTRPRESTFTEKVHYRPGQGERGDCDGQVDEYACLLIPVQPTLTEQRLVSTTGVGHALECLRTRSTVS